MPVVMEPGACGRSYSLLPGVRCSPARARHGDNTDGAIEIGIVNNMPDTALEATERQFIGLLAAASDKTTVRVRLFALPSLPRGETALRYLASHYSGIGELWNARLDGLIVTGTEPRCKDVTEEPYWADFAKLVDWAEHNTPSTVWSCLAAHAAVRHLDGIERQPFERKCFGVFECERTARHPLTAGHPIYVQVPHSRWNGITESALAASCYDVLTRAGEIGPDLFVKQTRSLFIFLQGHPEYEAETLLREYRRDVGRFLRQERPRYPDMPQNYFDEPSVETLEAFRTRALTNPVPELLETFPAVAPQEQVVSSWRRGAVRLYHNWLAAISARRAASARVAAAGAPELAPSQ
jgi:homoserine O-succinyltransferase/O-acetyltransferase